MTIPVLLSSGSTGDLFEAICRQVTQQVKAGSPRKGNPSVLDIPAAFVVGPRSGRQASSYGSGPE
jgi:hypothetical protein